MIITCWRAWAAPLLVAAAVLAVLPAAPTGAQPAAGPAARPAAQAGCGFVLGFARLRDLVGPQIVGACLEDERFNPANGNAEQRTTGGLLVWRKADNWTAFTDGHRTWVNGPSGLQQRLNSQRFPWEADAGAPGTATLGPAGAPDSMLDVHVLPTDAQFIMALENVRIRSGPGTAFATIGGVAAGQTARVTGLSLDRQWRRVVCPDGAIGNCWVSADPQLTLPVALDDQQTLQDLCKEEAVQAGFGYIKVPPYLHPMFSLGNAVWRDAPCPFRRGYCPEAERLMPRLLLIRVSTQPYAFHQRNAEALGRALVRLERWPREGVQGR
jgi:hypothetical protein